MTQRAKVINADPSGRRVRPEKGEGMKNKSSVIDRSRYPGITDDGWKALSGLTKISDETTPEGQKMLAIVVSGLDTMYKALPRREATDEVQ